MSPGGSTPQLAAQPARRTAVVGDGDDRREVEGRRLERPRSRFDNPVAAPEGGDARRPRFAHVEASADARLPR